MSVQRLRPAGLPRIRGYVGQGGTYRTWVHAARVFADQAGRDRFPDNSIADWLRLVKRAYSLTPEGRIAADYDAKIAEPFAVPGGETGVDLWPALDALRDIPVAIVRGVNSDILSADTAAKMLGHMNRATLVTIDRRATPRRSKSPKRPKRSTRCSPPPMPGCRLEPEPHAPVRMLHAHSSFSLGGKEARAVRLMNAFGDRAEHTILSGMPDQLGARDAIDSDIAARFPADAPSLQGKPGLKRYLALAEYMRGFDLVLTYNWGAMDAVMAHRLLRGVKGLPPLVHHEDGFNEDESVRRNWKRNLFRRLALRTASAVVVPSQTLARIARGEWNVADRLAIIANGIDVAAYAGEPSVPIARLDKAEGDVVIGTVAGLRKVKDLPRLVETVGRLGTTSGSRSSVKARNAPRLQRKRSLAAWAIVS